MTSVHRKTSHSLNDLDRFDLCGLFWFHIHAWGRTALYRRWLTGREDAPTANEALPEAFLNLTGSAGLLFRQLGRFSDDHLLSFQSVTEEIVRVGMVAMNLEVG
jgi:hypothetical protein